MRGMQRLVGVIVLLLVASWASAQTAIINPSRLEFVPSADHATLIEGQQVVTRYEARFAVFGGAQVSTADLGKPTPVSNLISMPLPVSTLPMSATTKYVVRVVAIGPTGEGVSAPSNPFYVVGPPGSPASVVVSKP